MNDLVQRLRSDNERNWQCDGWQTEAADTIERLTAERDMLLALIKAHVSASNNDDSAGDTFGALVAAVDES